MSLTFCHNLICIKKSNDIEGSTKDETTLTNNDK